MDIGFGISAAAMAMGLLSLISGTLVYRNKPPQGSILTTIAHIEGDLDVNLSSYAKLGACFTQGGYMDASSLTLGSSRSWKSMEMEIQLLLKKLLDINDLMSRCAASVAPTTSVTQKLARHRDILHEFTQNPREEELQDMINVVDSDGNGTI